MSLGSSAGRSLKNDPALGAGYDSVGTTAASFIGGALQSNMYRQKSEQFRKARNNYFRRGSEICYKCEAKMLVLIERNGKFYRFTSSDSLLDLSQAEIEANLAMSRTASDFVRSSSKTSDINSTSIIGKKSALAALGLQLPKAPNLRK